MTTEGSDHHRVMAHSLDTTAVHAGRHDLTALGVHALPIDLSSTNPLPSIVEGGDSYENLATGGRLEPGQSPVYQRLWNPTVARLESAVAELEHTEDALAFASGMAALSAVLLATVPARHAARGGRAPAVRRHGPPAGDGPAGHRGDLRRSRRDRRGDPTRHRPGDRGVPREPVAGPRRHPRRRGRGRRGPGARGQHVRHPRAPAAARSRGRDGPALRDQVHRRALRRPRWDRRRRRHPHRGPAPRPGDHRGDPEPDGRLPAAPRPAHAPAAGPRPAGHRHRTGATARGTPGAHPRHAPLDARRRPARPARHADGRTGIDPGHRDARRVRRGQPGGRNPCS